MNKISAAVIILFSLLMILVGCNDQPSLGKEDKEENSTNLRTQLEKIQGKSGIAEVPVMEATTGTVASSLTITGELIPGESAIVRPLMEGRLIFTKPVKVDDYVTKGEVLAKIDDRDLKDEIEKQKRQIAITKETINLDESELAQKKKDLEFDREMVKKGFLNQNDLRQAELALKRADIALRQSRLRLEQEQNELQRILRKKEKVNIQSPVTGIIVPAEHLTGSGSGSGLLEENIMELEGNMVGTGTNLFGVISREKFLARCMVNGKDKARLSEGMPVEINVITHKPVKVSGRIVKVARIQDKNTHAYKVWIQPEKNHEDFTSGLFVRAEVELEKSEKAVVIERPYLKEKEGKYIVQVVQNGFVENVPVEIGVKNDEYAAVIKGIEPGEKIICTGNIILEGQEVKPVPLEKEKNK